MRDIYYRAIKKGSKNEWVYGYLERDTLSYWFIRLFAEDDNSCLYKVEEDTISQVIPLNNEEFPIPICEGDIIEVCKEADYYGEKSIIRERYLAYWSDNTYGFMFKRIDCDGFEFSPKTASELMYPKDWYEVIGNKWDNPELVK